MKAYIYNWFNSYSLAYRNSADAQTHELKYQHALQVAQNSFQIALNEGFSKEDAQIAQIIGLLHDCGRFKQFEKYGTFNDRHSEDHALLSVQVIKKLGVLKTYSPIDQKTIYKSILHHNKREIPNSGVSERERRFMKLIRDADKIDIFRVMREQLKAPKINHKTLFLNQSEEIAYSAPILECIRNKELAKLDDMKTRVDFRLIQLSWIFDVNYKSTMEVFKKQGHLQYLIDTLPEKETIVDELHLIKNQLLNV